MFYFIFKFLLLFNYICPHFSPYSPLPYPLPPPTFGPPPSPGPGCPCPWVLYTCSLTLPLLSPLIPLPCPIWSLSVCSLFPYLWFYFACLFVLLIRFHLQVTSYGICLSPPGLDLTTRLQEIQGRQVQGHNNDQSGKSQSGTLYKTAGQSLHEPVLWEKN